MAQIGSTYLNFGLWAIALIPAWFVIRDIGGKLGDEKVAREFGSVTQSDNARESDSL